MSDFDDKFHDECGVFGIYAHAESANLTYLGLYALQHRGQESCGIVSSDGQALHSHRAMGLVADNFDAKILAKLPGKSAIGHVRYSTAGSSSLANAQPFAMDYRHGGLALAHNGNIVNAAQLREELESHGSIFRGSSDTEVVAHLIAASEKETTLDRVADALRHVQGAYSMVFLTETKLLAARDPLGIRPLVLGEIDGAPVIASETCAFDLIGAKYTREVEPGELIEVSERGIRTARPWEERQARKCIFEYIYFARPDSRVYGRNVYGVRKALGRRLAREQPAEADLVIPVPDSGVPAAMGFAEQSGLPFEMGFTRNHYVGRTFIQPAQSIRHFGVKVKLNPNADILEGKRIVVVDDSIVRGTTSRKLVTMLRQAGAREVHFRVSSPPTTGPCYYGIDTPTQQELIANQMNVAEIAKYLGADSLGYLSESGLAAAAAEETSYDFCDACFTGKYPAATPEASTRQMRLFEEGEDAAAAR